MVRGCGVRRRVCGIVRRVLLGLGGACLPWALAGGVLLGGFSDPVRAQEVPSSGLLEVGDIEMRYEIHGAGEPLVLLHGFGGCTRQWEPFLQHLTPHFRVILLDLRGHGASTNPSGSFTHRQAATDVLALLDRLGVERFRAMGMSTGAMTLLHLAARRPERLEAMVLISGTTHFTEEVRAAAEHVVSSLATGGPPELREIYGRCATRGDPQVDALLEQFAVMGGSRDDMDLDAGDLASIPVPTLIVHGDRDEFFPVDIPVGMHRSMPDASLWIVPGGDHVALFGPEGLRIVEGAARFLRETVASAAGGRG